MVAKIDKPHHFSARAHTNIALIKYWGKRDEELFLPTSTSLSLTLDNLYTDTRVSFDGSLKNDELWFDGELQGEESRAKISRVHNLFRKRYTECDDGNVLATEFINCPIRVETYNHVPTAAGLASSSSGFAALSWALRGLYESTFPRSEKMTDTELSTYARRGSGSATRSIFGGFVEWVYGTCSEDSVAVPVDNADWDIAMILVAISMKPKKISSSYGMKHTVKTSAFYPMWREASEKDLHNVRLGIAQQDIDMIGSAMEANCMKFHATMFAAEPPFTYLTAESFQVIEFIHNLRREGASVYFTMDAGPNVKVLCRKSQQKYIHDRLAHEFENFTLFDASSGSAPTRISDDQWNDMYGKF